MEEKSSLSVEGSRIGGNPWCFYIMFASINITLPTVKVRVNRENVH